MELLPNVSRQWCPERTYRFSPHPEVQPVQSFRLDNGLRILIHEDHRAPVFAYHTWFRVGSRHERVGRTGMAHLFEHLMFKETANAPAGEFDRLMEQAGAQTNAATWLDWTYYYEKLPIRHLELPFRLESDRMANMVLGPEQLEAEREVVINERRQRVDNDPEGQLYESLYALAYGPEHPYGWPTIGWEPDIRAITLDDCREFYRTWYAPNNAVLVICGAVHTTEVLELVDRYYSALPPQQIPESTWPAGPRIESATLELEVDVVSDRLLMAFPAAALGSQEFADFEVLLEVLFNSDSARLTRALVLDGELASGASAWLGSFRFPGLLQIDCTAAPDVSAEQMEEVILAELESVASQGISPEELQRAQAKLEADAVRELLSASSIAHGLGMHEVTTGRFESLFEGRDQFQAVSPEAVQRLAEKLVQGPRFVVFGRPSGELDEEDEGEEAQDGEEDGYQE